MIKFLLRLVAFRAPASGKAFREAMMRHTEQVRATEIEHQREIDRLWLRVFGRESLTVIMGGRDAREQAVYRGRRRDDMSDEKFTYTRVGLPKIEWSAPICPPRVPEAVEIPANLVEPSGIRVDDWLFQQIADAAGRDGDVGSLRLIDGKWFFLPVGCAAPTARDPGTV